MDHSSGQRKVPPPRFARLDPAHKPYRLGLLLAADEGDREADHAVDGRAAVRFFEPPPTADVPLNRVRGMAGTFGVVWKGDPAFHDGRPEPLRGGADPHVRLQIWLVCIVAPMPIASWAQAEAERLLGDAEERWRHVEGVAMLAEQVSVAVPEADRPVLAAAAWLHDVGDAQELRRTELQALDGALWLREQGEERLAGLVAYHSGAEVEAELLGLSQQLTGFVDERSAVTDALWYCDLTTGPQGQRVSLEERLVDVEARRGSDSAVARAMRSSLSRFEAGIARVEERLRAAAVSR